MNSDPVAETVATYDAIAADYIRNYTDRKPWQLLYDHFLKELKGKEVLDIGSGPGHDAKIFLEAGLSVTGIDLSRELLSSAKKKAPKASFIKMDVRQMKFPDEFFDGVWALASLQHLPKKDLPTALNHIRKIIKPTGIFYFSVTRGKGEGFLEKDRYAGNRKYFANYSEEEIGDLLKQADFTDIEFLPEERQTKFWNIFARPNIDKAT